MGQRSESRAGTQRGKTLFEIAIEFLWTYNLTRHTNFLSRFSLFVLVDRVTKNENRLRDFPYNAFHLQGKTGKDDNEK